MCLDYGKDALFKYGHLLQTKTYFGVSCVLWNQLNYYAVGIPTGEYP